MQPSQSFLILGLLFIVNYYGKVGAEVNETIWKGFSVSCMNDGKGDIMNVSVSCHGIKLVRKIIQKMLEEIKKKKSLEILNGVSLVERDNEELSSRNGKVTSKSGHVGSLLKFLESKELRIKLPSLLPENLEAAIEKSLPSVEQGRRRGGGGGGGGFGGGGGKKGDNGLMMVALMMGKMMAAMGFGALGLLAMKALMVSSLALMLSLIIAAKKLSSGKEEDSHHVVYAQEVSSHHRRRRSSDTPFEDSKNQPYRGYSIVPTEIQKLRL